ncbi:MAG: response regulator, partial [Desulfobacterales bacterium]
MGHFSAWKIVLIDDEEDIREVMTIALQDAGYNVDTAPDGATGLQLCEDISPQIVITDIRMPGIDGLQVLETIKKDYPDIEVIVATAFGEMDLAIRALQLDASDFITKPISEEALYLALKRARER